VLLGGQPRAAFFMEKIKVIIMTYDEYFTFLDKIIKERENEDGKE
jgi:hypothetical protein